MNRSLTTLTLAAVLVTGGALPALADADAAAPDPNADFSFEGPRIVGADFGLAWQSLKLTFGAGYESWDFRRDAKTGAPLDELATPWYLDGSLRLAQTWKTSEVDWWVAGGALAASDLGQGTDGTGVYADLHDSLFGFFQVGATRNRMVKGPRGVVEGASVEIYAEVGPSFLSVHATDYTKLSLRSALLVPLWNLDAPNHLFSGTLGFRANAQWIDGTHVPVYLLEANEVRGYQELLDTKFRSVATTELRVGLPSLLSQLHLVPVVFAFVDGGWYYGYNDAPAAWSDRSGWLLGAGGGVGLDFLGLTTPTLSVGLPLVDGKRSLWYKINFNLRF